MSKKAVTTSKLKQMKKNREPIVMMTAYDYPSARLVDESDVDVILVGDSLGMVVLGYDSTILVTLEDMLHHTKAVTRGTRHALVVTDMPFLTYQGSIDETLKNAGRIMQEGMAKAVKMEGGSEIAETISRCTQAGIPVMGHLGLTPQAVHQLGGYKVQGKTDDAAQKIIDDARALEQAGVFAIVLECVPDHLAKEITQTVSVPTIGIGAGVNCDGQVLVYHDILQYASSVSPKFVKTYANIGDTIKHAVSEYAREVRNRIFPRSEHTFYTKESNEVKQLYGENKSS
ncbi:MAG: 3-methyl-2-oxobutanoate hydroxymethyltransferase [Bacillaceae bacterium]|nr:3-methyl-2-oxobutanoate hydroxymethyltransferase [Bacillaceae bacterium]